MLLSKLSSSKETILEVSLGILTQAETFLLKCMMPCYGRRKQDNPIMPADLNREFLQLHLASLHGTLQRYTRHTYLCEKLELENVTLH